MRTLAVALVLLTLTPILGSVVIAAGLLGVKYRPGGVYERCARAWASAVCAAAGARIHVHGLENTRGMDGSGVVYCCNHVSWFDVLTLAAVLRNYTFISKQELARVPIFGWAARAVGIIFIDRDNRKSAFASYDEAAAELRGGKSVIVFPEGTRGYEYALRPFKKGPFVLAIAAGVPVVPTVVYGSREMQSKGSMKIRGHRVDIHFLEPVSAAGLSYDQREQVMRQVWQRMAAFLKAEYGVESSAGPVASGGEAPAIPTSFF